MNFFEIEELTLEQSKNILKNTFRNNQENKATILQYIRDYYKQYKPQKYFFEPKQNTTYTSEIIKNLYLRYHR